MTQFLIKYLLFINKREILGKLSKLFDSPEDAAKVLEILRGPLTILDSHLSNEKRLLLSQLIKHGFVKNELRTYGKKSNSYWILNISQIYNELEQNVSQ